jgi:hypothetical protein
MLLLVTGRRKEVKLNKWWFVRALNEIMRERKIKKNVMFYCCGTHNKDRRVHT